MINNKIILVDLPDESIGEPAKSKACVRLVLHRAFSVGKYRLLPSGY